MDKLQIPQYQSWFSTSEAKTLDELKVVTAKAGKPRYAGGDPDDSPFESLQVGQYAICTRTGGIVKKTAEHTFEVVGVDVNFNDIFKKFQNAQAYKESTSFKMIERTAKRDAYVRYHYQVKEILKAARVENETPEEMKTALLRVVGATEYLLRWLDMKVEGHTKFLDSFDVEYCYATQSFKPREYGDIPETETPRQVEG